MINRQQNTLKIAPSILSADFCKLGEQVKEAEGAGANRIQIDVMDGCFVPNISIGLPVIESIRKITKMPLEAHLMIVQPERYINDFKNAGADTIIIHQEACIHLHRTCQAVRAMGIKVGVALNPATSLTTLEEILEDIDLALIMTVNPGFGGQKFIHSMLPKIKRLSEWLNAKNLSNVEIEVDGGVDSTTLPLAAEAGASVFVAGSSVYSHNFSPADGLSKLNDAARSAGFTPWVKS